MQSPNVAFDFVRSLAAELSGGHVDLPSFPEIALQVRRVLSDPNTRVEQIVRVVGSEPALAARLLRIANSASINRSGKDGHGSAHGDQSHRPQHGAQRIDFVLDESDPQKPTNWRAWRRI